MSTTGRSIVSRVFRFAPSPNGDLHLGHALSALFGFEMARRTGGRFLVRIEDIDTVRSREAYIQGLFDDLDWLGIRWEEPVLRQSTRFAAYGEAAHRLETMGLLYPCFATRTEIAEHATPGAFDPDGAPLYPGLSKTLPADESAKRKAAGEPFAQRLDMEKAIAAAAAMTGGRPLSFHEWGEGDTAETVPARPGRWGDAVIVRKETPASYHLAVVVDDAFQGVTDVTRGMDLYPATGIHRLLQVLLGLPEPQYRHHHLLCDDDGQKLSKSARARSLRSLREQGTTAAEIRSRLGFSSSKPA